MIKLLYWKEAYYMKLIIQTYMSVEMSQTFGNINWVFTVQSQLIIKQALTGFLIAPNWLVEIIQTECFVQPNQQLVFVELGGTVRRVVL